MLPKSASLGTSGWSGRSSRGDCGDGANFFSGYHGDPLEAPIELARELVFGSVAYACEASQELKCQAATSD
jgi:hypothetical protein